MLGKSGLLLPPELYRDAGVRGSLGRWSLFENGLALDGAAPFWEHHASKFGRDIPSQTLQ